MANMKKEQVEFLAVLDSILMALKTSKDINIEELLGNINVSANPFDFLIKIITKFVGYDEMVQWLVNVLTYSLPVIEVGVKGVLLANLKNMLSCTLDPKIPEHFRKENDLFGFNNKTERGIPFNVANIDYKGIFQYHPQSEVGQTYYFGTQTYYTVDGDTNPNTKYYKYQDAFKQATALSSINPTTGKINIPKVSEIDTTYQLARANDFNAFLWFIIHQCNFTNIQKWDTSTLPYNLGIITNDNNQSPTQGQVYYATDGNNIKTTVLSLCTKAPTLEVQTDGTTTKKGETELLPFSSTNNSGNWYVNRGSYFKYLLPKKMEIPRDYEKEFAICNIAYEENDYDTKSETLYPYGNLRFTVLPAPAIHTPLLKEPPWRIIKFLFNKDGKPDKDGKYSVNIPTYEPNYYDNDKSTTTNLATVKYYGYKVKSILSDKNIGEILVNVKTGKYEFKSTSSDENIYSALYECYPGLTVYEFNYDYVMGMQLYDPKVIARQLVETTLGVGLGLNISLSTNKTETAYQMRIANIVKEIVEADAYEASDCFFTFSNEKYDELLNDAEKKRAQGYSFANSSNRMTSVSLDDAYAILNEFNDNATLQENQDVFTRAFNNITASITEEVLPEDKYNVRLDIITKLIQGLILALMEVILSPKVIMLFEVNRRLMGGTDIHITFEDFLKMISGLIVQIITELRDMLLQMILDWVLQLIGELADKLRALLMEEQFRFYAELLKRLLQECKINFPLFGHRKLLDSQLDVADYADIDEVEKPKDSNC